MSKQQHFNGIKQSGFTVIELVAVILFFAVAAFLTFRQISNLETANANSTRKTAINAMHYALEEVYYKDHKYYPATLTSATLPSVDPKLFTDPDGFTIGKELLSESDLQKIQDGTISSESALDKISAALGGKSPNYHYDAADCDTDGKCKKYTLRADLTGEAEYVKKSRTR